MAIPFSCHEVDREHDVYENGDGDIHCWECQVQWVRKESEREED